MPRALRHLELVPRAPVEPITSRWRRDGVPLACALIAVVATVLSGISPKDRAAWLCEVLPVAIAVPAMALTYRRFRFSERAYLQVLTLVLLHVFGSHYTYGDVPLGYWLKDHLGLLRNDYDRMVHFSFGLLLFWPFKELLFRDEPRRRLKAELLFVFALIGAIGMLYELLEWGSSMVVTSRTAAEYVGAQGDFWDAQKDMFCDVLGGLVGLLIEHWRERPHRHT